MAVATLLALRFPLSKVKEGAERFSVYIIGIMVLIGIVQATLWRFLHGVSYTPASESHADPQYSDWKCVKT